LLGGLILSPFLIFFSCVCVCVCVCVCERVRVRVHACVRVVVFMGVVVGAGHDRIVFVLTTTRLIGACHH
jgi:hypothetical protein